MKNIKDIGLGCSCLYFTGSIVAIIASGAGKYTCCHCLLLAGSFHLSMLANKWDFWLDGILDMMLTCQSSTCEEYADIRLGRIVCILVLPAEAGRHRSWLKTVSSCCQLLSLTVLFSVLYWTILQHSCFSS